MRKNKLFLLLALLLTAATGAWATDVYVVGNGTGNWLNGVVWDPGVAENKMTEQNGVYSITFTNVDANSELQFKFAINGSWDVNYGCTSTDANELNKTLSNIDATGGMNFLFGLTEKADVTISFNLSEMTYMISTKGMKAGDDAAATYTVSLKDGVKDADKWSIEPKEGLSEGDQVTLQYNGRLKVKGVKATSDAQAAEAVPDGAIGGKFSVSDSKQVYFSKGNLRYASSKWSFFDNQWDYNTSYSADAWDHFGWSTSATTYGMNTSQDNATYSGDFVDWGATMGTGWFTLSSAEWTYLFNTRSASTVNGTENGRYAKAKVNDVQGVILFPDTYTHPDGVTAPTNVNTTNASFDSNTYTVADWTKMESAGCVFLPAAGRRNGSSVSDAGSLGYYWSSSPDTSDVGYAYPVFFFAGHLIPAGSNNRYTGFSVRLVQATSDEQEAVLKTPATVTTAPTGAAGLTTASAVTEKLVTGGVADGGTLKYAITNTTTQPDDAAFTLTSPTVSDLKTALSMSTLAAGTYYVWYKVFADANHADSEAAYVSVVVAEATPALSITNPSMGQVIGSDGKNYAYGSLPTGVTAVAKIWYVSGNNGLALALTDEGNMNWSTAKTTCAAHTAPFTGGTWKLATKDEWDIMISAAGYYTHLRDGFSSVGGTNMQSDFYWSSTEDGSNAAWGYDFSDDDWVEDTKDHNRRVRACLVF